MHDETHALDVAQEVVSEPRALACSLDKTGDIRNNETVVIHLHNAEIWIDGRKVIIGNLWLCRRQHTQKCGFTHVREAYETDVRNGFEFERDLVLFRSFTELRERRCLTS